MLGLWSIMTVLYLCSYAVVPFQVGPLFFKDSFLSASSLNPLCLLEALVPSPVPSNRDFFFFGNHCRFVFGCKKKIIERFHVTKLPATATPCTVTVQCQNQDTDTDAAKAQNIDRCEFLFFRIQYPTYKRAHCCWVGQPLVNLWSLSICVCVYNMNICI